MPNADPMWENYNAIKADVEHWEQGEWVWENFHCGTYACYLGWQCLRDGLIPEYGDLKRQGRFATYFIKPDGERIHAKNWCMERYNIDNESADLLSNPWIDSLPELEAAIAAALSR